jgi:hypothetical protein
VTDTLHFLPWLRRGLGLDAGQRDTGQVQLPRVVRISPRVDVDGVPASTSLALRPADHASAIDGSQIVRRFPQPGALDAEHGYFPLVEVLSPELPWVLTPARADERVDDEDSTGRLRPWLVLVCVPQSAGDFVAGSNGRPARLVVPVEELPDLGESYAWAHVQSTIAPEDVATGLASSDPGAVIARFVCPRRLEPNTRYRAALVAAFAVAGEQLVAAWDVAAGEPAMPALSVYDTWTFTTGEVSSFEELCLRLGPVQDDSLVLGLHTLDVTELGCIDPWPAGTDRVTVEYTGALWDSNVSARGLGQLGDEFDLAATKILNEGAGRVVLKLSDPDPVVAPPFYGRFATNALAMPEEPGWQRQVNLGPNRRAAAGLGADIVRIHQERFMAMAWNQAGALRETNRELSRTRLQAEIGRTWRHRARRLDPLAQVSVLRSQLTFVRADDGQAPRRLLANSTVPAGLATPAFLRQTRPGAVVATAVAARGNPRGDGPRWTNYVATSFGTASTRRAMHFGAVGIPAGTGLADPRRPGGEIEIPPPQLFDDLDIADVAAATAFVQPVTAARRRITRRIPALAGELAGHEESELPTRVRWGPTIGEALMWLLVERSAELLLPGVQDFPLNAVRVVEANPAFVASFLAGANHEMAREMLWREFPADLSWTTFHRFWDRPNRADADIDNMVDWPEGDKLVELGAAGGESVVVLVRGDLVRLYPSVRILLQDPAGVGRLPTFGGWIPPDVRFVAFDVPEAELVTAPDSAWQVVFEEQQSEPRFGLDTWPDGAAVHLAVGDEGDAWGLNAAHAAAYTYQAPFRYRFRVVDLIGGTG